MQHAGYLESLLAHSSDERNLSSFDYFFVSFYLMCVIFFFQLESQLPEENDSSLLHTKESVSICIMEPQFRPHSVDSLD